MTRQELRIIKPEEEDCKITLHSELGIGSGCKICCVGSTSKNRCASVGTLGSFVVVENKNEPAAKYYAAITCRHTIICDSCKDTLKNPERNLSKDVVSNEDAAGCYIFADSDDDNLTLLGENYRYIVGEHRDVGIIELRDELLKQLNYCDYFFFNRHMTPIECVLGTEKLPEGYKVQKCGNRTRRTVGKVLRDYSYDFVTSQSNIFSIIGDDCDFSAPGDSGSLVTDIIDTNDGPVKAYGIVYAGIEPATQGEKKKTLAVRLDKTFDTFSKANIILSFPAKDATNTQNIPSPTQMRHNWPKRLRRIQMYSNAAE